MTRPLAVIYAAATLAAAYAVSRIRALGFDVDPSAVTFLAGLALGLFAGVALGRAKQRRVHAFAVWKGHPR